MVKKAQVAIVAAIMIIILIVLAIMLSGHLFGKAPMNSVKDSKGSSNAVYVTSSGSDTQSYTHTVKSGECCKTNTFISYGYKKAPVQKTVHTDSFYHVPTCCNDVHTYTHYWQKQAPVVVKPIDNTFYVSNCYN